MTFNRIQRQFLISKFGFHSISFSGFASVSFKQFNCFNKDIHSSKGFEPRLIRMDEGGKKLGGKTVSIHHRNLGCIVCHQRLF